MSGRAEWERCDSCGRHYPDIYWADDEQWAQAVGDTFAGLRCPECFKAEAWAQGLEPVLRFLAPPLRAYDAHLIAAAPDLYEALETMLRAVEDPSRFWSRDAEDAGEDLAFARAALAAARGETPEPEER